MAQVAVTLNGRTYQIACDDGQEDRLRALGGLVDERVGELVASVGQIGDLRLMVMVSLLLADELVELREQAEANAVPLPIGRGTGSTPRDGADSDPTDLEAEAIERLAERVEMVAAGLEAS